MRNTGVSSHVTRNGSQGNGGTQRAKGIHVVYVYVSRWARPDEMERTTHADDYG